MGRPQGFAPEAALEALGAPMRARCGAGAAAWIIEALAAPGTQGSWWLGQQEIQCSRRARQPTSLFLPRKSHGQRRLAGHSPQGHKQLYTTKVTLRTQMQNFF